MKSSPRYAAFSILLSMEQEHAYSNIQLDRALSAFTGERRDKAFISLLVNGVCERRLTLDFQIRTHLTQKSRIKPAVRVLLRLGIYEILFCDGIPPRASVNEYVELAKNTAARHATGLINAILRRTAENGLLLPPEAHADYLSVRYSFPSETVALLKSIYGENTERFLASSLEKPKIYGRVNTNKTDLPFLQDALQQEGLEIMPCENLPDSFYFLSTAAFMQTRAFRNGLFHIQDLSSQLCCKALQLEADNSLLDVCAAPGGKAFTAAEILQNTGSVLACDIHEHKIKLMTDGAKRLGLTNFSARLRDASVFDTNGGLFDRILCDVPCSGLGVIRKKPEIKYRPLSGNAGLPELQLAILETSARYLKPGGRLVYSTCTVTKEENEDVVLHFLQKHPEFSPAETGINGIGCKSDCGLRLSPFADDCDGFFIAPLIRRS